MPCPYVIHTARHAPTVSMRDIGALMIRHVVLFRFVPSATVAQIAGARSALIGLKGVIPEVREIGFGPNYGPSAGDWPWVLCATCDDMPAVGRYLAHPAHVDAVNRFVVPIREARLAVDFET